MDVKITDLTKVYDKTTLFDNFNAVFESGKITAILGNSGVGKTTLLNALGGITPYKGKIIGAENCSYVFQNQCLIKGLTVAENLDFVLASVIKDKAERKSLISSALKSVELESVSNSYPSSLSTGMAQRVSIARAFVYPSDVILMDEPFRGLDIGVKTRIIKSFLRLWKETRKTVVFVTHSIDEALLAADRIVVLGGKPVVITSDYSIDIDKDNRDMNDERLSRIFSKLYTEFTEI